ncbi:MAG: shikimate dehydrogenase [Syntrophobacterales bacterium]|nr:MAG: shikimate dehydrogenase [Syntrophobacterales bacterium]
MICIPIVASTEQDALITMEGAESAADVIEVRLDLLPREVWTPLLKRRGKPSIVTLRPERQGGQFNGEEAERIRLLGETLAFNPSFIDVEWDTPSHLISSLLRKKGEKTTVILSYHNFEETPDNLEAILRKVNPRGGDLVKIVTHAKVFEDNMRILRFVENNAGKTIAFCMGPLGLSSRVLTLRYGGLMTFGSLEKGKESAPGQIPSRDLREIYRVHQIHRDTRVFGLLGDPVFQSLSPIIHNSAFQALGCDAVYIPFQVRSLETLLPVFLSMAVEGFSVTIPHKERIIPHLDGVDDKAKAMGAVNTVYRRDGRWLGTNTDGDGAWRALEEACGNLSKKRWAILGAGGAARAVAYSAGMLGCPRSLTFLGRTQERLEGLLWDMGRMFSFPVAGFILAETDLGKVFNEIDVIVNCTPIGMFPRLDETPIPSPLLRPSHLVFDTVYNPLETRLLREARVRGCRTISGLQMFLQQAVAQFELWTGKSAPLPLMEAKARERLER